jgi:hypothetical protein
MPKDPTYHKAASETRLRIRHAIKCIFKAAPHSCWVVVDIEKKINQFILGMDERQDKRKGGL